MSDLDQAFQEAERNVEQGRRAAEVYAQRLQHDDRSLIAKLIVYAFVGLISAVVLVFAVAVMFKAWTDLKPAAEFLVSLLSSVLLPVVTLVIGYYFGKEK